MERGYVLPVLILGTTWGLLRPGENADKSAEMRAEKRGMRQALPGPMHSANSCRWLEMPSRRNARF
jgi:hypothetical protein